jgi:sigma-54 dependent transcriptional regulator, acetoin dehydrogenase operon transcriptional activator AcoR
MSTPKLLLVTKDIRTQRIFYKQLAAFFADTIEIILDEKNVEPDHVNLVVKSSPQLSLEKNYPPNKIIIGRRALNVEIIKELVKLPQQTECLVVNNLPETTYDTIQYLENLGLNLRFFPYYPGMKEKFKETDVAIIPTATEMVPKDIKTVIDIGVRPLDISSIIEIGTRLAVNMEKAHIYSAKYIKEIIHLTGKLMDLLTDVNKLNELLDTILNTVHDGIIATNEKDQIIKVNNAANRILGLSVNEKNLIDSKFDQVFPKLSLPDSDNEYYPKNKLVTINNKKLVVNRTSIKTEDKIKGDVIAFQDVTRIQDLEHDIRKQIQKKGFSAKYTIEDIIGNSKQIEQTIRIMKKIGKTDRTVLITGENGTGKELFAHSIHHLSGRKNGPFIPVNFAGLPESLAESELFGYDEGTFTGGSKGGKQGLFELAHNGTIFLDEIGDASLSLQILLLRVLQEQQVMRVGGRKIIPVNIRIIAATNKDLKKLVAEGKFREDLYYRLFVLPLRIPPLRERKEDIPLLINTFIKEYSPIIPQIEDDVLQSLLQHHWPGNIRELMSVIQYMTIVMEGTKITRNDLPEQLRENIRQPQLNSTDLLTKLNQEAELDEFYYILKGLYDSKIQRVNIGRGKIMEYLNSCQCNLSEQQVRRRMQVLKDVQLIYSGNKGHGSKITDEGIEMLKVMENNIKFKIPFH